MTDVRNLSDGQEVQVWSNSARSWIDGKVLKKENRVPDGLVALVEYGDPPRQKWLTAPMVAQAIRVTASPTAGRGTYVKIKRKLNQN